VGNRCQFFFDISMTLKNLGSYLDIGFFLPYLPPSVVVDHLDPPGRERTATSKLRLSPPMPPCTVQDTECLSAERTRGGRSLARCKTRREWCHDPDGTAMTLVYDAAGRRATLAE